MRKILIINFPMMLFTRYGLAQCGNNEVEVRVEIATDNKCDDDIAPILSTSHRANR